MEGKVSISSKQLAYIIIPPFLWLCFEFWLWHNGLYSIDIFDSYTIKRFWGDREWPLGWVIYFGSKICLKTFDDTDDEILIDFEERIYWLILLFVGKLVDSVMESSCLNREKLYINMRPICYRIPLHTYCLLLFVSVVVFLCVLSPCFCVVVQM